MNRVQRHREIKAAMAIRGVRGSDIARKLKITRQAVYRVVARRQNSRRVIAALIEAGVPAKLFDDGKGKNRQKAGD